MMLHANFGNRLFLDCEMFLVSRLHMHVRSASSLGMFHGNLFTVTWLVYSVSIFQPFLLL